MQQSPAFIAILVVVVVLLGLAAFVFLRLFTRMMLPKAGQKDRTPGPAGDGGTGG